MSDSRKKFRTIVDQIGLYRAATAFRVTEESVLRYLADCRGADIREGTKLLIESQIDAVAAKVAKEETPGGAAGGAKPKKPAAKKPSKAKAKK